MSLTPGRRRLLVAVCLTTHALLLLHSLFQNYVTVDEVGHVPAGLSHWQTGRFEAYRVNPPLARMLATLPLLATDAETDYRRLTDTPGDRPEWNIGLDFIALNAGRYFELVCLARLAGVAWSLLGAYLVYRWARELYGDWSGVLAMALWCFEPNVLANAQIVTPDLPATVAGLAATYVFWHYLRDPSWPRAWFAGVLLGVAQLTKFTCLVFYAVWPVLFVIWQWAKPKEERVRPAAALGHAGLIAGLSLLIINLGYGFDRTGRKLGDYRFVSWTLAGEPEGPARMYAHGLWANRFRGHWLGEVPVPLPAEYVNGIDLQRRDFESGFRSYLGGELRHRGWWYYYLYGLAIKVPLGLLALVAWNIGVTVARRGQDALNELTLWLPALAVLVLVSSQTGFSHHLRYVLPLFPFVIVSTSKLAAFFEQGKRLASAAVIGLVLYAAGSTLAFHPHHLSYFNELVGGPNRGHEHLVDSNIDWGQDLLFLKDWLDRHPEARPLRFAYYNLVDPRIEGIEFTPPPQGPTGLFPDDDNYGRTIGPHPGWHAVSVNLVCGLSWAVPDGRGSVKAAPAHAYSYFQHFTPIAKAGYSIFIYHITLEEANRVRRELGLPLLPETEGRLP